MAKRTKEMLLIARTVRKKKLAIGTVTSRHNVTVRAYSDKVKIPPNRAWICAHDMLKLFEELQDYRSTVRIGDWVFEEVGIERKVRDVVREKSKNLITLHGELPK